MCKGLYHAFCARAKRPGQAAKQYYGVYQGCVEPLVGGKADGDACPQPAQSGYRFGCHGNSYSDLSGTVAILG